MQLCVTTNKENMVFTKNKEKMVVNKNININIDSYPISMAISIVPNIVDIDISLTPALPPNPTLDCPAWKYTYFQAT